MDRTYRLAPLAEVVPSLRAPAASLDRLRAHGFTDLSGLWTTTQFGFPTEVIRRIEQHAPGRTAAMNRPVASAWLLSDDRLTVARVQEGIDLWSVCAGGGMACTTASALGDASLHDFAAVGQHVQVLTAPDEAVAAHGPWSEAIAQAEGARVPFEGPDDLLFALRLHWRGFQNALRRREASPERRAELAARVPVEALRALPLLPAGEGEVGGWAAP